MTDLLNWIAFTTIVTLITRMYFFHNVDFNVLGWTLYAIFVSIVLNAIFRGWVLYAIFWVLLALIERKVGVRDDYDAM